MAAKRKRPPGPKISRQERRKLYKAKIRQQYIEQGLTSRGTERIKGGYLTAIRNAGRMPSVAALVMREQRRYWRANPKAKAEHHSWWASVSWWLEYQTKPDLRLYHREKSRRRKAQNRGQTPVQIPVSAIRLRFNSFGNCCAYCGTAGEMELEHVVAISQGGAHDISNIVPACKRCNTSKRAQPMEEWYRAQPFFSELRLRRILRVTGNPSGQQLLLSLA